MKQISKKLLLPFSIALISLPALADHEEESSQLQDAWLDGKIGTVVLFNKHLNPLDIETDVVNGRAIITGRVDSVIHRELMTELALSVEGIEKVDNQLIVSGHSDNDSKIKSALIDASITTAISTKLLLNTAVNSFGIEIDTSNQTVVIEGTVDSALEKDLVGQIAFNTSNVDDVINKLRYSN